MLDLVPILDAKHRYNWIIVFGDTGKSPEICGAGWKTQQQTDDELKQLYEKVKIHAYNWGPIMGNGIIAFDFDWPWAAGLWHHQFKERADTLIIETPNGGARVFYHTKEPSLGDPFKENFHFEIKTNHYVAAGGEALTQDGDLKPYTIVQDNPIKTDNEILGDTITYFDELLDGRYSWLNYHCISEHLNKCKKRIVLPHETGLAIANFMLSSGCEDWEIHNFRKAVWDYINNKYVYEYDEKKTQRQIDSTHRYLERKGKPPTCRTLLTAFNQSKDACKGCPRKQEATTKTIFKSVDYVQDLIKKTQLKTIETSTSADTIWRYAEEKGIWLEDGVPYIEKNLRDLLGLKLKPRHLTEAIRIAKVYTYIKPDDFIEDLGSLPLQNGEYEFSIGTLAPFNQYHNHRSKLPIKYDTNADCPTIKKFLREIAPGDEPTIQEIFGYLLVKGYPIQKCFIFQGSGANGKSTLLRLMEAFIGKENVSNVNLYDLVTKTFSKAELYNKLANIAPDIGTDELKRTGIFKALTGGDTITAERKNQHPFQFNNHAKMIYSCNQLPTSPDNSDAFFRRFVILQFKQVFDDTNADKNIIQKLTTQEELSGLFNLALIGYNRLMKKMYFTESKTTEEMKKLYLQMSDPINSFINEMIEEDSSATTFKDDLYRYYNEFCIRKGFTPAKDSIFFKTLRARIYVHESQITFEGKKGVRALVGIRVVLPTQDTHPTQALLTQKINLEKYSNNNNVSVELELPVQPVYPVQVKEKTPLSELLGKVLSLFPVNGDVIDDESLFGLVEKDLGLSRTESVEVVAVLMRDGTVFSPRPGWYKRA